MQPICSDRRQARDGILWWFRGWSCRQITRGCWDRLAKRPWDRVHCDLPLASVHVAHEKWSSDQRIRVCGAARCHSRDLTPHSAHSAGALVIAALLSRLYVLGIVPNGGPPLQNHSQLSPQQSPRRWCRVRKHLSTAHAFARLWMQFQKQQQDWHTGPSKQAAGNLYQW